MDEVDRQAGRELLQFLLEPLIVNPADDAQSKIARTEPAESCDQIVDSFVRKDAADEEDVLALAHGRVGTEAFCINATLDQPRLVPQDRR